MARRRLTTGIPIWVRVSGIVALVLAGAVVSSMLLGGSGSGGRMEGMDHNGGRTGSAATSESEPMGDAAQVVTVTMEDGALKPVEIEVERGALVRLEFENTGALLHDFTIEDMPIGSAMHLPLEPGASGAIEFRATEPGEYEFYCDEPGHRDAGMFGVLRVVTVSGNQTPPIEGGPSGGPGDHAPSGGPGDHAPPAGPRNH